MTETKLTGFIRILDEEFDPQSDYRLIECILTKERLALEWNEDGERFFAKLFTNDGVRFEGNFGTPTLDDGCKMFAVRHTFNETTILFATWTRDDSGYCGMFNIILEEVSRLSVEAEALTQKAESAPETFAVEEHYKAAKMHDEAAKEADSDKAYHRKSARWHRQWAKHISDSQIEEKPEKQS